MRFLRGGAFAAAACLGLVACHLGGKPAAPTGQVVATVGDREITQTDLRTEMGNAGYPDEKSRKAAEVAALRNIVIRVVLANEAKSRGLEKTPDFAVQKTRLIDNLLVQSLQQKDIANVPQPTKDETQNFMASHPDIFQERKIFTIDQIRMPRPSDPSLLKTLEPLKTLDQIEDVLKTNSVPFERVASTLDTVGLDSRTVEAIVKLPPKEMFVLPGGQGLFVDAIQDTKVVPFTGDKAVEYAQKLMTRERVQAVLTKSFSEIMQKAAPTVQFAKEYAAAQASLLPAPPAQPAKH